LGILLVLGVVASRYFTLGGTLSVVLLTGFGALLPRAAYFQPEPVFSCSSPSRGWRACAHCKRTPLWMHALIGVFGGLAYLAKGSVEPLLFLYVVISTLRWMWGWVETLRPGQGSTTLWLRRNHWIALFILFFCYFMTAGPRLTYAAKTYGNPFHSYPSYWMWFDDFKDCFAWMDAHNTKAELQAMTPEEKPGFQEVCRHPHRRADDSAPGRWHEGEGDGAALARQDADKQGAQAVEGRAGAARRLPWRAARYLLRAAASRFSSPPAGPTTLPSGCTRRRPRRCSSSSARSSATRWPTAGIRR